MTYQPIPRVLSQPTAEARERAGDTWERIRPEMLPPVKIKPPGRSLAEQSADPLPPLTWARPEVKAHFERGGNLKSLIRKLSEEPEEQLVEPRPPLSDYAKMTKAERAQRILGENHCGNDG